MIRAALLALALSISPAQAVQTGIDQPTPYLIDNNTITRIDCNGWLGTGVYVGNGMVITARHVVQAGSCAVDGKSARVISGSLADGRDFAELAVNDRPDFRALIDCSGFHEGQQLLATGYALGVMRTVTQRLTASNALSEEPGFVGLTILRGSVTQGMSGGSINDLNTGALVGIINANSSMGITQVLALPLSKTPLCKGQA